MDIGFAAIFDMSPIIQKSNFVEINWNLTPIKVLGIIAAVHYAFTPCENS